MTPAQIAIMLAAGASAALGQFGVTLAYRYAPPKSIAVYDYTNVIFTAMLGFCFFGQIPDFLSVSGFAVILFAAAGIGRAR
jgi:drug/metabolite transporter (DMT)-like permease